MGEEDIGGVIAEQRMYLNPALRSTKKVGRYVADKLRANRWFTEKITGEEFASNVNRYAQRTNLFSPNRSKYSYLDFYNAIRVANNPYISTIIPKEGVRFKNVDPDKGISIRDAVFIKNVDPDKRISIGDAVFSINEEGGLNLLSTPVSYNNETDCFQMKNISACKPGREEGRFLCFELLPEKTECKIKAKVGEIVESDRSMEFFCGHYIIFDSNEGDRIIESVESDSGLSWQMKGPFLNIGDYDCEEGKIVLEVVEEVSTLNEGLLRLHGGEFGDFLGANNGPIRRTLSLGALAFTSQKRLVDSAFPEPMNPLTVSQAIAFLNENIQSNSYLVGLKGEIDSVNVGKKPLEDKLGQKKGRLNSLQETFEQNQRTLKKTGEGFSSEYERLTNDLNDGELEITPEQNTAFAANNLQALEADVFKELIRLDQLKTALEASAASMLSEIEDLSNEIEEVEGKIKKEDEAIEKVEAQFNFVLGNFKLLAVDSLVIEAKKGGQEGSDAEAILREKFEDRFVKDLIIKFYPELVKKRGRGIVLVNNLKRSFTGLN